MGYHDFPHTEPDPDLAATAGISAFSNMNPKNGGTDGGEEDGSEKGKA